jgi:aminoglycoside phosphotransferase (APT) family kinase protein
VADRIDGPDAALGDAPEDRPHADRLARSATPGYGAGMDAFRSADRVVDQDWGRLASWLAGQGHRLDLDAPIRQFGTGLANLNYLVVVDDEPAVFRRPPAGPAAEGANDMAREYRVLSKLSAHFALAPRPIAFCADPSVLDTDFQLIEYRAGRPIGATLPEQAKDVPDAGERLTSGLIEAMAGLHALDPIEVGLGDLGRPEGFLARQVEGWARRSAASFGADEPASVTPILAHLRASVPSSDAVTLLHLDLKFDNMLYDLDRLEPVAIVDWDMATRGDPLYDLGVLLSYWVEPGDPPHLHKLDQVPSLEPGFPDRAGVAARYFAASGREPVDLAFYVTLARFRLAIVWQQLYERYLRGALQGDRYESFNALAKDYLNWTADSVTRPLD